MANSDFVMNEKDFEIPEGWEEVGKPTSLAGPPNGAAPVDRLAGGAIASTTLGLQTDIAHSQLSGEVPIHRVQPPQPSAVAAANSAVQSVTKLVPSGGGSSSGGGITSAALEMPPQFTVGGSPITPPSGTEVVTWNLESAGTALGVPLASASVGGTWDTTAASAGIGTTASVTGTPSESGESVLFFVNTAGATQPSAPVPSGSGWTAIDNSSSAAFSIYTQEVGTGSFTASAPITSNTWTCLLAFFGGGPLALVQKNSVTSGGFSGQPTGSQKFSHAFSSNVTAGNLVIVLLEIGTAGSNPIANISATDTLGTVYSSIGNVSFGGGGNPFSQMVILAGSPTSTGACTLSVTLYLTPSGTTIGDTAIIAYELSGPSVVSALPRFVPVGSILGAINLNSQGPGGVMGILPLFSGGTAADLSSTGGTSEVLRQSTAGGPITVSQLDYPDLLGNSAAPTYLTRNTAAAGLVAELAAKDLTAQNTNAVLTNLYPNALVGLYRVNVYMIVSTAATVSSTLPDSQIQYVDRDSGATITVAATPSNTGNTTSTFEQATFIINAAFNSTIKYAFGQVTPYASSGATPMAFSYRVRLEYLG